MKILTTYIASSVFNAVMAVLLVVAGLNFLGVLAEQLGDVRADYTFFKVLLYVCWRLPGILAESLGFAAMIGCLVGLGVLANHNELTVLRASGVSLMQIAGRVMLPVLVFIAMGIGLDEIASHSNRQAESMRALAMVGKISDPSATRGGPEKGEGFESAIWNRVGDEFVRFDRLLSGGNVVGVFKMSVDADRQVLAIDKARRGSFMENQWQLLDVENYRFEEGQVSKSVNDQQTWASALTPKRLEFVANEPEHLTVAQLMDYRAFLEGQGQDGRAYALEYWKKILKPLLFLGLVMLAMSFVFGSMRQVSVAQRVFLGVIVGISLHILQDIAATASLVYGFSPLAGVLTPIAICFMAGWYVLQRVR